MKNSLPQIAYSAILSVILLSIENVLGSNVLKEFLKANVITILVALLALNSSSLALILSKIRDITDKFGDDGEFDLAKKELLFSIKEQVFLIGLAVVCLVLRYSNLGNNINIQYTLDSLIRFAFIYAVFITYDSAKGVFVILDFKSSSNNNKNT